MTFPIPEPRLRNVINESPLEHFQCDKMAVGRRFFDTVATNGDISTLVGELQHHGPGCYTTHSGINRWNRRVENLLLRADDARDRRRAVLRLTARGARVNGVAHGTVEAAVSRALEGVSERERIATRRVLERLASELAREDVDGAVIHPKRGSH